MTDTSVKSYRSSDGITLAYRDSGDVYPGITRPPVICIPGMTRNGKDFAGLSSWLSSSHRVLRPDLRGRGASEWSPDPLKYVHATYVEDLRRLLDHCDISQAILIGTSLGGVLAMRLAAASPNRVAAIILNDIGPGSTGGDAKAIQTFLREATPAESWGHAAALSRERFQNTYPRWRDEDWRRFSRALYTEREDGAVVPDYDPSMAAPFERGIADDNDDLWDIFGKLTAVPILLIRGALSSILTPQMVDRMAVNHPTLSTIEIPNVGHAPILTERTAVDAIGSFLADIG